MSLARPTGRFARRSSSVPSAAAGARPGCATATGFPTDEVKGPADAHWQPIESHPTFAEAAADIEPPPPAVDGRNHLDMNPLIDVCLVLLIFFILTITYASLERAIDVPEDNPDDKGPTRCNSTTSRTGCSW